MLLDVSPLRLAPLKTQVVTQQRRVVSSWAQLIFSLVGMMLLICLVYVVLNWLTKGYYSARLAIVTIILVVVLSVILLVFNRAEFIPFGAYRGMF